MFTNIDTGEKSLHLSAKKAFYPDSYRASIKSGSFNLTEGDLRVLIHHRSLSVRTENSGGTFCKQGTVLSERCHLFLFECVNIKMIELVEM